MLTDPESGFSKPATHRSNVVFPEPEGPRMTVNVPELTLRETPLTAVVFPYFFERSCISRLAIELDQALEGRVPHSRGELVGKAGVRRSLDKIGARSAVVPAFIYALIAFAHQGLAP